MYSMSPSPAKSSKLPPVLLTNDDEKIAKLVDMGFNPELSRRALQETAGILDQAVQVLLFGGGGGDNMGVPTMNATVATATATATTITTIQGTTSQYTVENGRSACTCMALCAALKFLTSSEPAASNVTTTLTPNDLDAMVRTGSHVYHAWRTAVSQSSSSSNSSSFSSPSSPVEHTSPEDALQSGWFPRLILCPGGIRQGLAEPIQRQRHTDQYQNQQPQQNRSSDAHNPLGWYSLLSQCQQSYSVSSTTNDDETDPHREDWICVVITKPPETVLVCLPPLSRSNDINHTVTSPPHSLVTPTANHETSSSSDTAVIVDGNHRADTTDTRINANHQTSSSDTAVVVDSNRADTTEMPTNINQQTTSRPDMAVVSNSNLADTTEMLTNINHQTSSSDTVVVVDSNLAENTDTPPTNANHQTSSSDTDVVADATAAAAPTTTTTTPPLHQRRLLYHLIDSHPRPSQFQTQHAYCRSHESLSELVDSLQLLFPAVNLNDNYTTSGNNNFTNGTDLMAAMYNSYDLYPLTLAPLSPSSQANDDMDDPHSPCGNP